MKTQLVTVPLRGEPDNFPPLAPMALMAAARKAGIRDVEFFHIDYHRPTIEEAVEHIRQTAPDVLAISAVVSTSYAYTKALSLRVKEVLPDTLIVLGGNQAASANLLLRRTGVDMCVNGEGERTFVNLLERAKTTRRPADFRDVKGLILLDEAGEMVNTGFEDPVPAEELYDIDWEDLRRAGCLDWYVFPAFTDDGPMDWFKRDPRALEPHRRGKTVCQLVAAKGCVARCTFCHRWDKGIRFIPLDTFMARLDEQIGKYNAGFLAVADENFGSDREWVFEFCRRVKPYDILWHVGGMRARTVTPDLIAAMKDAGCTSIIYGIESGSERMLQVMENENSLEQNRNAIKWTVEAGLNTVLQLVVGMPGETPETIRETISFSQQATTILPEQSPGRVSVNYAQALPGTPLYEYARHQGLIGSDPDGEEAYLLHISDTDAADVFKTLNFTDCPMLEILTWRPLIRMAVNRHYVEAFGIDHYMERVFSDAAWHRRRWKTIGYYSKSSERDDLPEMTRFKRPAFLKILFSGQFDYLAMCYPVASHRARFLLIPVMFAKAARKNGLRAAVAMLSEYLSFKVRGTPKTKRFRHAYTSLRKIVSQDLGELPGDDAAMAPMRRGR